jgi:hypothetical protein
MDNTLSQLHGELEQWLTMMDQQDQKLEDKIIMNVL